MLRWLKKRAVVHLVIAMVFVAPMIGLLRIVPDEKKQHPLLNMVRLQFDSLENATVDYRVMYGRTAPVSPEIVFVTIDAPSISLDALDSATVQASPALSLMHSSFPYPREVYALACERILAAGARVVALDVWFPAPSANDQPWKAAIDAHGEHLVVAMNFADDPMNGDSKLLSLPAPSLFPDQDPLDPRLAYVNFWPDTDDVVRKAQYRTNLDHVNNPAFGDNCPKQYSFAALAVQKGGHPDKVPDDLHARSIRFAGWPLHAFKNYSLYEIFDPKSWKTTLRNGEIFRDKIVVIGPAGDFVKDKSRSPYGLMDGAEIHLNAINALLQNDFLQPASTSFSITLVLASGLAAYLLAMGIASIALRFFAALVVFGGYLVALMWAYNGPGWLLPAIAPLGVFSGATGVGYIYDFVLAQVEKFQLRMTFERYTSPNEARFLLAHMDDYNAMLAGTTKPVTALFSDVRNFTTMSEEAAATGRSQQFVAQLNEYLTAMVDCVFHHDGSLDKFIGDAVMAVWGKTPYNQGPREDAVRAVRAALDMLEALRRLNARWTSEGKKEWHIGVGLNHGQVIVGDMGSQRRKEFAVLGDAVNLASRLESLTKEYQVDILLGESVAELIGDRFHLRSVDLVQVKGKTQAVDTFTVLGEKTSALSADLEKFLAVHEEGIRAFRAREFVRARECFTQALVLQPGDPLAASYLASIGELILHPPDDSWTGVRVMTKK